MTCCERAWAWPQQRTGARGAVSRAWMTLSREALTAAAMTAAERGRGCYSKNLQTHVLDGWKAELAHHVMGAGDMTERGPAGLQSRSRSCQTRRHNAAGRDVTSFKFFRVLVVVRARMYSYSYSRTAVLVDWTMGIVCVHSCIALLHKWDFLKKCQLVYTNSTLAMCTH